MRERFIMAIAAAAIAAWIGGPALAAGDAEQGARAYRACAACHALQSGRHMTGPSLAGILGRGAASVEGFDRYSPALKAADLVWDESTMNAWIADPQKLVPGNRMTFRGIGDAKTRADLIAYLKSVSGGQAAEAAPRGGGMMRQPERADLKALDPEHQVASIRHCRDTYRVTTVAGTEHPFWEFNLRFKTDTSEKGPPKGRPALIPASMMGDRAFVIFADPSEISPMIRRKC